MHFARQANALLKDDETSADSMAVVGLAADRRVCRCGAVAASCAAVAVD